MKLKFTSALIGLILAALPNSTLGSKCPIPQGCYLACDDLANCAFVDYNQNFCTPREIPCTVAIPNYSNPQCTVSCTETDCFTVGITGGECPGDEGDNLRTGYTYGSPCSPACNCDVCLFLDQNNNLCDGDYIAEGALFAPTFAPDSRLLQWATEPNVNCDVTPVCKQVRGRSVCSNTRICEQDPVA